MNAQAAEAEKILETDDPSQKSNPEAAPQAAHETPNANSARPSDAMGDLSTWIKTNLTPLIICGICLVVGLFCEAALINKSGTTKPGLSRSAKGDAPSAENPSVADNSTESKTDGDDGKKEEQKSGEKETEQPPALSREGMILTLVVSCIMLIGFISSAVLVFMYLREPRWRDKISAFFGSFAQRPQLAIGVADFVAAYLAYKSCAMAVNLAVYDWLAAQNKDANLAGHFIINDIALLFATIVVAVLMRRRAGIESNSNKAWPFLSNANVHPKWTAANEAGLGAGAYILIFWVIAASSAINQQIWKLLRQAPMEHPLLPELSKQHDPIAIAILFLAATVGAAFFEETLFRGVLYNAISRNIGKFYAAVITSFFFALVHQLPSAILPYFILGMALTWLYEKTGRLIPSMMLHAVNNAVTFSLSMYVRAQ